MTEPTEKELAARLRKLATGTVEWRVQHPVEKSYCISFDRSGWINPERAAREWLADHQRRFPQSEHAKYEVVEVRFFTDLERAALDAADALERTCMVVPDADAAPAQTRSTQVATCPFETRDCVLTCIGRCRLAEPSVAPQS